MLSQHAVEYLSCLTHRPDAKCKACYLPFAGIYWEDEIPDFKVLFALSEADRDLVFRLFSIRKKIWDREIVDSDDQEFWDEARVQAPEFALFRRLDISANDRAVQNRVSQESLEVMEAWLSDADKVVIIREEHGIEFFSATYDLAKRKGRMTRLLSWWKRFFNADAMIQ